MRSQGLAECRRVAAMRAEPEAFAVEVLFRSLALCKGERALPSQNSPARQIIFAVKACENDAHIRFAASLSAECLDVGCRFLRDSIDACIITDTPIVRRVEEDCRCSSLWQPVRTTDASPVTARDDCILKTRGKRIEDLLNAIAARYGLQSGRGEAWQFRAINATAVISFAAFAVPFCITTALPEPLAKQPYPPSRDLRIEVVGVELHPAQELAFAAYFAEPAVAGEHIRFIRCTVGVVRDALRCMFDGPPEIRNEAVGVIDDLMAWRVRSCEVNRTAAEEGFNEYLRITEGLPDQTGYVTLAAEIRIRRLQRFSCWIMSRGLRRFNCLP